ncbi:MAG TPA: DUF6492 family protein [Polyangiaceae bacterium]
MTPADAALITPSFRGDLERCRLLVDSVGRHVPASVPHYLVVDRRDVPLFRSMEDARTRLLVVEEVIPWWIMRIPRVRRFWWSWRSGPVKNWVLQQIVKLSIPKLLREPTLYYVDSDVFFVDRFDPASLMKDGKAPLFRETGQKGLIPNNDRWHAVAAGLLGMPVENSYDTNFIGNIICWRRSTAMALLDQLSRVAETHWVRAIARKWSLSEYVLYGMFATRVSEQAAREQYWDSVDRTACYWDTSPMDRSQLDDFRAKVASPKVAVMISAKSRTDVGAIRSAFGFR